MSSSSLVEKRIQYSKIIFGIRICIFKNLARCHEIFETFKDPQFESYSQVTIVFGNSNVSIYRLDNLFSEPECKEVT